MKWVLFCLLVTPHVQAAEPSRAAIYSCLLGRSISPTVTLDELPTHEILSQNDYRSGYNATYYFKVGGKDIGYAEKGDRYGIIFAHDIHMANTAKLLIDTTVQPTAFNPSLADWSKISDATGQYLCASFNFEGLGRSGSFQRVRGGYLLSMQAAKHSRKLFFVVANIDPYTEK